MQEAVTAKEFQDQKLIDQGYDQGAFNIALEVKKVFGIEKALMICEFTREELENEMIGMQEAVTAKEFQDQKLIDEATFKMALKAKKVFGIEKALMICEFTREELENEKLNR